MSTPQTPGEVTVPPRGLTVAELAHYMTRLQKVIPGDTVTNVQTYSVNTVPGSESVTIKLTPNGN